MDIKDLMENIEHLQDFEFERRLNKLVRDNHNYKNLDASNRKVVMDLVNKYKRQYLRKGIYVSEWKLRDEWYKLRRNRIKLGLTEEDLKDIREILWMFKG